MQVHHDEGVANRIDLSERISVASLNMVASEKLVLLKGPLDALRSGEPEKVEKYEDLLSSGLLDLRSQMEAGHKKGMQEQTRSDERKRKSDRLRVASNLAKSGFDEKSAQRIVDEIFSTHGIKETEREQIVSKIAAGDLQNPDDSLIELFKKLAGSGVAAALSSRRSKEK